MAAIERDRSFAIFEDGRPMLIIRIRTSGKGKPMKLKCIYALLLATAIVTPSAAQVSVYIGSAPPPVRYETRGPMPGPGYAWVEGYWAPDGRHYRWVQGRWDRPP